MINRVVWKHPPRELKRSPTPHGTWTSASQHNKGWGRHEKVGTSSGTHSEGKINDSVSDFDDGKPDTERQMSLRAS